MTDRALMPIVSATQARAVLALPTQMVGMLGT
jgi:hypothetical protein